MVKIANRAVARGKMVSGAAIPAFALPRKNASRTHDRPLTCCKFADNFERELRSEGTNTAHGRHCPLLPVGTLCQCPF